MSSDSLPQDEVIGKHTGSTNDQSGQLNKQDLDATQEKATDTFDSNATIYAMLIFTLASVAGAYNMGFDSMTRDLDCSQFQATLGLSVYALGFGIVPLVTASFSEEFGRQPLYIGSSIGFLLMFMMVALSQNIQTVIIARFLQGAFGSTGSTMVGGTIADIWSARE
ncbi:hypothetical protein C0991_010144 [Blastosporella zonata]|nr:hypothetical protein C0991_010144 [Blastosporella zonata]